MFPRLVLAVLVVALAWAVVARAGSAAGPERVHIVKPGETLWSIALDAYGDDPREGVWRIEQRNGVDGGVIRVGQRLVLPSG